MITAPTAKRWASIQFLANKPTTAAGRKRDDEVEQQLHVPPDPSRAARMKMAAIWRQ
jgi:hypothetical protein